MGHLDGTFAVLVPLPRFKQANIDFMNNVVDKADWNDDERVTHSGNCIEDDPHITVHMGLHKDEELARFVCEQYKPFDVIVGGGTVFSNTRKDDKGEEYSYDALVRKVLDASGDLESMHEGLVSAFKVKREFKTYIPHVTVGYLKKDTGDQYLKELRKKYTAVRISKVIYKEYGKDKSIEIALKGK